MNQPILNEELMRKIDDEIAWRTINAHFSKSSPRRFINGIVVSSRRANSNGRKYHADGAIFKTPLPLLWKHQWERPLGKVTSVSVRGEALYFTAEICNSFLLSAAEDVWRGLRERMGHGISSGTLGEAQADGDVPSWTLREISVTEQGADADARVLKVWQRDNVIRLDQPQIKTFWEEA